MERITFSLFTRLLTNQPYFVWHKGVEKNDDEDQSLEFEMYAYKDVIETSIQEIQAKSFNMIEKKFDRRSIATLPNSHVVSGMKIEERIQNTKAALENKTIEHIINPVFAFEYKGYQVVAQPKIFSKNEKKISFLKISTSTKVKDILRFMFDYMVLEKLGYEINDASLFIIETKDYKKGEVAFYETRYINTTKATRRAQGEEKWDYTAQQLAKTGVGVTKKGMPIERFSIIEILKRGKVSKGNRSFLFLSLPIYLEQIIDAKNHNKIVSPTDNDNSFFESSQNWDFILEQTNNPWHGYSGYIVSRNAVIDGISRQVAFINSDVAEEIGKNKIVVSDRERAIIIIAALEKKVVWYDFEAISLPFCPMDHILPFNQVVSQVSIIKTESLEEMIVHNIVKDPKHINPNDFVDIINAIYEVGANYVVYNKAYENARLKEMIRILEIERHPDLEMVTTKVHRIIDNTIDLADFFICKTNKMPIILIPFLKGKYSIKIIERYISQANLSLPYQIREYKHLEVKNGAEAMEIANNRAIGIIGDNQWKEIKKALAEYCENDVRAMIIVYHLVKNILENH